ncbi:hypothetical protein GCM10009555_089970 [Acrocarpospora macrocephala]|uniref:Uncharacterized protein n=1 Tax=Acrocarpospora macrocephala TaxID=150177 RepID=A0A5M3WQF6_9ACTN|nr:hypothetical protein Amac_025690 [Acrocarpospora macrocephala]
MMLATTTYSADMDNAPPRDDEPSVCPACGAGAEQSSDPERMWASICYCGHPRFYDYKHHDGTCPCLTSR